MLLVLLELSHVHIFSVSYGIVWRCVCVSAGIRGAGYELDGGAGNGLPEGGLLLVRHR